MHRHELRTGAELPIGDVEVPVAEVVARVADDDRRDRLLPSVRLVRHHDRLAGPLPSRVGRGQDEQRRARVVLRRVRGGCRGGRDDLRAVDRQARCLAERAREGRAMGRREVGDDSVWDPTAPQLDQRFG